MLSESRPNPIRETTAPPKFLSILGMGFGDCGKGLFTDFFCRHWNVRTIVRFNGGAQAGHNVVLPDGRRHTFSQFGAGTFNPAVKTVLASPFVVHPGALWVENKYLKRLGVNDALSRLTIDGRCRVNTPFHQAAGRLREILRGDSAHGTCGIGFGETVGISLAHPDLVLRYRDLAVPARALEKLSALRNRIRAEFLPAENLDWLGRNRAGLDRAQIERELEMLRDETVPKRWLAGLAELCDQVPAAGVEAVADSLRASGPVLFEGAQGILLDEWKGFHPHTTWSSTHAGAVDALLSEWGFTEPVFHLGVMRAYLTRHGRGPLPTHDPRLDLLPEPHNGEAGWQGPFRRGHPDEVLLKYAVDAIGRLSGILLSHLDAFDRFPGSLKWCRAYDVPLSGRTERLTPPQARDLAAQETLTDILARARPCYDPEPIRNREEYCARVSQCGNLPILFGSTGNTHRDVAAIHSG